MRARVSDDPYSMVALWMIGYEDESDRSAAICICEIFGRDTAADHAARGMGVHPFGDPRISDEFAAEMVPPRRSRLPPLCGGVDVGARDVLHQR